MPTLPTWSRRISWRQERRPRPRVSPVHSDRGSGTPLMRAPTETSPLRASCACGLRGVTLYELDWTKANH